MVIKNKCIKYSIVEKADGNYDLSYFHTDLIERPGALFTFGTSREGTSSGQGAYFFFEKQPNVQNKT